MKRSAIKKRPLSDTVIASLEPEEKLYREPDSRYLYLQVKPTGAKSWVMRYKKSNGKWAWHGLGAYPAVTGAMARAMIPQKLAELASGADKLTVRQVVDSRTFKSVAMEWYNSPKIQELADDTKGKYISILNVHIFPKFANKDISEITRKQWLDFFTVMQEKTYHGKPIIEQTTRAVQVCSRIYRFAITHELAGVTSNPLDYMHERLKTHTSEQMAHVTEEDLPKLLATIQSISQPITRIGIELLAHMFLRPSEVLGGKWCEIDFDKKIWDIPASRMKKRRPHLVPLSDQVIELLTELEQYTGHDENLFPSKAQTSKNRNARFNQALKRKGYNGEQTLHGFRHIASTKLNDHTEEGEKFDKRVIEFALAHKEAGVAGVYNKADYFNDRKQLNQWYSDFLDRKLKEVM
ncbi:tyrosine-type recombinase/integrase [Moraxella bovoculi]|uniref:tyrosine-type recombinase/integrase n=1 Tax=Moraxella bovoculi TaxID=386891 RepID=UPI000624C924|nr:tyrosine-type recombinase/integrase [Moraxella bovoculi]AKG14817.2 integrase [Moraxella bovoculi]